MFDEIMYWIPVVGPGIIFLEICAAWWYQRQTYKLTNERITDIEEQWDAELAAIRYRMDKWEGKHLLRAKSLGVAFKPLPQPRPKEDNGE